MMKINNKVLRNTSGKILKPFELPKIEFENRGLYFPNYDRKNSVANINITSTVPNTIYVDHGDGSPVVSRDFDSTIVITYDTLLLAKTYTDLNDSHIVKIWFKIPSKITRFTTSYASFYGDFPIALAYYNINALGISNSSYLNDFSDIYPPGYYDTLTLTNVTLNSLNHIPEWIIKSRIMTLRLGGVRFNLNNPTINNMNKLIGVKDLTNFAWIEWNTLSNIPSNFKDIATLRGLGIGPANITSITPEINACKQLTNLSFGYNSVSGATIGTTQGIGQINSWGSGLVGMVNLTIFNASICPSLPDSIMPGIEDCNLLKRIVLRSSFLTTTRADNFVSSCYNKVDTYASKAVGNTLLRQVTLEIGWISQVSGVAKRPTGTYQAPAGYIQGISNGTPASPMEMLYILVKQYRWSIIIPSITEDGLQTLT